MDKYFATKETGELVDELVKRVETFNNFAERTGWATKWAKCFDLYFGRHMGESGLGESSLSEAGEVGELTAFGVNHYRNLIKHVLAMTTSQRPSFEPRAINSDLESLQQARLAGNIIETYMTEKRMARYMDSAAERALVFGKAFIYESWDKHLGKTQMPAVSDELGISSPVREGDISIEAKSPWDVIYDVKLKDWTKANWVIVRTYESKWDLAARHPDKADQFVKLDGSDDLNTILNGRMAKGLIDYIGSDTSDDLIPVYKFFHKGTDAVPTGRMTIFLNGRIALEDGPAPSEPYTQMLPVFRITPGEMFDTSEGYSESFDVILLQQVINVLYNIPFNNQQAFGVQAIWIPDGCELSTQQLGKGLALLKGGPPGSEPKPLQLTATPAEIFKNTEGIEGAMQKLMGLNSVVTGDPDQNLKSGVALGRLQAMAVQFNSNFQKAWAYLLEDTGSFLLKLIKHNARTERLASISGKHNKGAMASYTGENISKIDRVVVDLGNPLSRTVAGRIEMADKFIERNMIDAKEYIQVVMTGQIDSVLEHEESELELIRKENESMMDGSPVRAIVGDSHLLHAKEHKCVINDPMLRNLAAQGDEMALSIIETVTMHIQEHEMLHSTQTPFWGMISGEPPPPMPPPQMGPPMDQGMPPGPEGVPEAPPPAPIENAPTEQFAV
jgi:hypothetical protein